MNYLLDTQTAIWLYEGNDNLSAEAVSLIKNPKVDVSISIASAWEIAIKINIGKLQLKGGVAKFISDSEMYGIKIEPIKERHLNEVETMPLHHRDPFDRLIIATAISENMAVITSDDVFRKYAVKLVL